MMPGAPRSVGPTCQQVDLGLQVGVKNSLLPLGEWSQNTAHAGTQTKKLGPCTVDKTKLSTAHELWWG